MMRLFIRDMTPTPLFYIVMVAIYAAVFGGIGYVLFHFISKYW